MSPYSCGMAAIPVRPENHGTRAAGAYGDGPYLLPPCLLPLCQLHPSAAVSRPLSPGFLCFGNGALTALHDKSDGFFRRQIVLTTKDRPAGRADDPFLVDKLLREKEGIFLWCLEGLHRLIGNNYQFSISGKARENMETVKRSSNNVIEFLQSEGYIRFKADSEASSKAIYEAYTRWCDDNAQKPMSANRVSSELAQNERLYNVEATNNVHVGGKRVRGFMGIEAVNPLPY